MDGLKARFSRLDAAGNTFYFCDLAAWPFEASVRSELAKKLCTGFTGSHTDGLVFIGPGKKDSDFEWDFYNADGSNAEMCGNAARAAGFYLNKTSPQKLKTRIGIVEVGLAPSGAFASWGAQFESKWENEIMFQDQVIPYDFINTGVPHAVVEMDPFPELARELRKLPLHHIGGMNVTFVEQVGPGEVTAVTFERGVEDFTLSCGTGAVAAALWSKELSPELRIHQVSMPGGLLGVSFEIENRVMLTGPVKHDYDLEVNL